MGDYHVYRSTDYGKTFHDYIQLTPGNAGYSGMEMLDAEKGIAASMWDSCGDGAELYGCGQHMGIFCTRVPPAVTPAPTPSPPPLMENCSVAAGPICACGPYPGPGAGMCWDCGSCHSCANCGTCKKCRHAGADFAST